MHQPDIDGERPLTNREKQNLLMKFNSVASIIEVNVKLNDSAVKLNLN